MNKHSRSYHTHPPLGVNAVPTQAHPQRAESTPWVWGRTPGLEKGLAPPAQVSGAWKLEPHLLTDPQAGQAAVMCAGSWGVRGPEKERSVPRLSRVRVGGKLRWRGPQSSRNLNEKKVLVEFLGWL